VQQLSLPPNSGGKRAALQTLRDSYHLIAFTILLDSGFFSPAFPVVCRGAPSHPVGMNCWLVKQEPEDYSWADFVQEKKTAWTGVRNYQARNNLRAMAKGDEVLFYHSGTGKEIVGVACVAKSAYADPTAEEGDWSSVDLVPVKPLKQAVPLAVVKADAALKDMALVKNSRLSVMPVNAKQFARVLKLGGATQ